MSYEAAVQKTGMFWLSIVFFVAIFSTGQSQAGVKKPKRAKVYFKNHDTPQGALSEILKRSPEILGIGEYHQNKEFEKIPSSMRRFTDLMLPAIKDQVSDILFENWLIESNCDKEEEKKILHVEKTLDKPETAESDLVHLAKTAKSMGIKPHILRFSCKDYNTFHVDGEIEFGVFLKVITKRLKEKATKIYQSKKRLKRTVIIFGGLLHNTLYPPDPYEKQYSYAHALQKVTKNRYIELDLIVPEYIEKDPNYNKREWFKLYQTSGDPNKTFLIRPRSNYYIILLPRTK